MKVRIVVALFAIWLVGVSTAQAFLTNAGQTWTTEPDAWTRGNTADASYFGWDRLEGPAPPVPNAPMGSYKLDDSTPDLGSPTTALSPRFAQTPASLAIYGHRSSGSNYYSGFPDVDDGFPANALADDVFSGTTPASGIGGFTTIVLQVLSQPGSATPDLNFTMDTSLAGWAQVKDLIGTSAMGGSVFWQEWTAPGNDLQFAITMSSTETSRALDAFQIDTFWTAGNAPVVNARLGIPEPSAAVLGALAAMAGIGAVRRRRNGGK